MFQFTLQALLKIRRQERDLQRQSTAEFQIAHDRYVAERDELIFARNRVLKELRGMNESPSWIATQALQRQQHAEQLGLAIAVANDAVSRLAVALEESMGSLTVADKSVQALEQLKDRKQIEHRSRQDRAVLYDSPSSFGAFRMLSEQ